MQQGALDATALQQGQGLKKVLRTRDLVVFGMVFMAPVSAQTLFGELTQVSQGHAVMAYLIGLVAMIFTAFCYGKMAGAFPRAGSTYNYTSQAIHPNLGFMAGWAILLDYLFLPILLYKLSAIFAMELVPFVPFWLMLFVFVIPVTLSNILGAKTTSRVNMGMTALMLLSLVLFIAFAIKAVHGGVGLGNILALEGIYNANTFSMSAVISGASIAVLSYLGFDAVTTMAEDSRVTGKMVGRGAVLALLISSFFYILQVYFATVAAPDFTSFQSQDTAFFEIAVAVGGNALATVCTLIIAVSGIATALAGQASASRVLYGMGRDGMLPNLFSKLNPRFKTPVNSILILGAVGYLAALLIPLEVIFAIMVYGALLGFICVNVSVIVEFYYRRKERTGKYVFTNLLFPLIGSLVCGYIFIGMDTVGLIVGTCWILVGFVFLIVTTKGFKQAPNVFDV